MSTDYPPILVTHAHGAFRQAPELAEMPAKPNEYGITGKPDWFGDLRFEGVPVQNLTAGKRGIDIVLTLPDLVLLRDQLIEMVNRAQSAGVLDIPDGYAPVVAP